MKYQVIHSKDEFVQIRSLLYIAVHEYSTYHDEYIKIMVHDAQEMISNRDYRFRANKRIYHYSSFLSRKCPSLIQSMKPEHLGREEYIKLLDFFEAL